MNESYARKQLVKFCSLLYDRELTGWNRITRKSYNQNAAQRTEVLWCNFDVPELLMDNMEEIT